MRSANIRGEGREGGRGFALRIGLMPGSRRCLVSHAVGLLVVLACGVRLQLWSLVRLYYEVLSHWVGNCGSHYYLPIGKNFVIKSGAARTMEIESKKFDFQLERTS